MKKKLYLQDYSYTFSKIMCAIIILLLTVGIPTFTMIYSSISGSQTDFDKQTAENSFTSMAIIFSIIITISSIVLIYSKSPGIKGFSSFIIIVCIVAIAIILGVCFSTETFFSFWNFFDEWFWRKPKGSTNAVRSDTFASHWYLGEIYLILFFISLVIVAGIFRIIYIYSCRIKKIYCTCRCFEYNHNTLSDDIKDKSKPLVNPIADNV